MACSVFNKKKTNLVKLIINVIKTGLTKALNCSFTTIAYKLYKICTNVNYIYCIKNQRYCCLKLQFYKWVMSNPVRNIFCSWYFPGNQEWF